MIPEILLSAASIIWYLLSIIVFVLSLLLTAVILIQDSKDTGLTSAFGGGAGGSALLGARMQKDLAKLTAIMAVVVGVCLIVMSFLTISMLRGSAGADAPPVEAVDKTTGTTSQEAQGAGTTPPETDTLLPPTAPDSTQPTAPTVPQPTAPTVPQPTAPVVPPLTAPDSAQPTAPTTPPPITPGIPQPGTPGTPGQ